MERTFAEWCHRTTCGSRRLVQSTNSPRTCSILCTCYLRGRVLRLIDEHKLKVALVLLANLLVLLQELQRLQEQVVEVQAARGLLGEQVVLGFLGLLIAPPELAEG